MSKLPQKIASFSFGLEYSSIPVETVEACKKFVLDTVGVIAAGARDPIRHPIFDYLDEIGGRQDASVIATGRRASLTGAAFANGVLGHVDDYDDTNHVYFSHQSIAIVPTILALGEKLGKSGRDAITAYVVGTEVQWRLGDALVRGGDHYRRGWHATGTIGSFGAAAAASKMLGLTEEATARAIGIVASEAGGIQAQFGTQAKAFQAGRTNEVGIRAALLARSGMTSSSNALEGQVGYLSLVCGTYDVNAFGDGNDIWRVGETWCGKGQALKAFPVCGAGNGLIERVLSLRGEHNITMEQIERIECAVRPASLNYLNSDVPESGLEAKFSIGYWIAAALVFGRFGMEETTDAAVKNPKVRSLMSRISVVGDENVYPAVNSVKLFIAGRSDPITALCGGGKGSMEDPLSKRDLLAKFANCCTWGGLSQARATSTAEMLLNLEEVADISQIMQLIAAPELEQAGSGTPAVSRPIVSSASPMSRIDSA